MSTTDLFTQQLLSSFSQELEKIAGRRGLWDNIHAKRARIAAGSGERMRKPGSEGAPTAKAIRQSQTKTAEVLEYLAARGDIDSSEPFAKEASIEYRGTTFPGYNKPVPSNRKGKKKMVLVKRGDKVKLVHFGQKGYQDFTQHKDPARRKNYLARSGGIRGKGGKLTANDPFSANYWARKELW